MANPPDMQAVYTELAAADETNDFEAMRSLAWGLYAQLGTTAADLAAARAWSIGRPRVPRQPEPAPLARAG